MKDPIRINNVIVDRSRILWVQCDQKKVLTVVIRFEDGQNVYFEGPEAVVAWEIFDKEKKDE